MRADAREDPGVSEDQFKGRAWWEKGVTTTAVAQVLDDVEAGNEGKWDEIGLHGHWEVIQRFDDNWAVISHR